MNKILSERSSQEKLQKIYKEKLKDVTIIICTLSTFDKNYLRLIFGENTQKQEISQQKISLCIIDEAPQCTETGILAPLRYHIDKLVLIGDPKQLGPVILDPQLQDISYNYSRSLYERLLDNRIDFIMLDKQYRAEKTLSQFTSEIFYERKIADGQNIEIPQHLQELGFQSERNFFFIDITDSNEDFIDLSYKNVVEAQFIYIALDILLKKANVSVICAYKAQANELQQQVKKMQYQKELEIETVDAFQGKEQEVVIVNLVRTEKIGFLSNIRRINVALSRAKFVNIIVGNRLNLCQDETWNNIIEYLDKKKSVYSITSEEIKLQICSDIFKGKFFNQE